jgi:tetratricopeptide (TPR) repeat protein
LRNFQLTLSLTLSQPTSYLLLGNRSLTSLKLSPPDYSSALSDAEAALKLAPTWAKGYVRKGEALEGLERYDEAKTALEAAIEKGQGTVKTGE